VRFRRKPKPVIIELQPDDVLVYETPRQLTMEEADRIGYALEGSFPGRSIAVVTAGTLRVVR